MLELQHKTRKGTPLEQVQEQQQASSFRTTNPSPRRIDVLDLHPPAIGEMAACVPAGTKEMFPAPPKPAKSNEMQCGRIGHHRMDQLCGGQDDKANQGHADDVHG